MTKSTALPQNLSIIGIDIGRHSIDVCYPDANDPQRWPVVKFTYKSNPDWWLELIAALAPGAAICAEPTGWHYLHPIYNLLHQNIPGVILLLANHTASAHIRAAHISTAKTDQMDARALAFIAQAYQASVDFRGVRAFDADLLGEVLALRTLLNEHQRIKKQSVRFQNQLRQYAHSMFPALADHVETYKFFIERGAAAPIEMKELVLEKPGDLDGRRFRHMQRLADKIPPLKVPEVLKNNVIDHLHRLKANEQDLENIHESITQALLSPTFERIYARLSTIPGAFPIAIAAFLVATNGLIEQFDANTFKAVCGVNPQTKSSGKKDGTKMSKTGYRPAMNALWTWTMYLVSAPAPSNAIATYYKEKQKTSSRAFYAARSKLARMVNAVAKSPAGYRPAGNSNQILCPICEEANMRLTKDAEGNPILECPNCESIEELN